MVYAAQSTWRVSALVAVVSAQWLLGPCAVGAETQRTGESIYKQQCAECHGQAGEGVAKEYPHPLTGDRSATELARYIAKEMPKGDAGSCTGAAAKQVAEYIFDTFYSPDAQLRNKPPRVELSRLTVRQYRNALADLLGGFRPPPPRWEGAHGLRAEYFKTNRLRDNERVVQRIDPQVSFNFGEAAPTPKDIDPKSFAIRWQGSLLAPDTGEYELIVNTENAARLWLNDNNHALVDASVRSGSDTEHRGTIWLLGGHAYPIRLEITKDKQKTASIALLWKQPHQTAQLIPARLLSPARFPETYVVTAPFPPDDRSVGYERGTSISKDWDQATTAAAIETAGYVSSHLSDLSGARDNSPDRNAKLRDFCKRFVERAFRRPLTDEQRVFFVDHRFEQTADRDLAVRQVVLLALKSPRFLYRELGGAENDAYDVASRLSFSLWDSLPDQALLEAAAAKQLSNPEQAARQAQRMATDLRAQAKLRTFLLQWLKVEQAPDLSKDAHLFPEFDVAAAADLRESLEMCLDDLVGSDQADFRELILSSDVYLNGRLAKLYGVELPADAPFQKIPLDLGQRAGVISHPYLLTYFAYSSTSSPIHRGVFLARSALGRSLRQPPQAVTPLSADAHAGMTTRQRVELQTGAGSCQVCHGMINRLGFTLEHFDAVGRYRKAEAGKPIDAGGAYDTRSGSAVKFNDFPDVARFVAENPESHAAFVRQLFHYVVKQPLAAYPAATTADLNRWFAEHEFNVRSLMAAEAVSACFTAPQSKP